jgi:hypothetical protein
MFEFLSQLGTKDIPALTISMVSLVIALTNAVHSIYTKSRESIKSAQTDFDSTVEALIELKQKREEIRQELGDEWGKNKNSGIRVALGDRRELLLSKATLLLKRFSLHAPSITLISVAATRTSGSPAPPPTSALVKAPSPAPQSPRKPPARAISYPD